MRALALALVFFSLAHWTGCSASHEPLPDDAPLPGDLLEIDLTDAQSEALCDWWKRRHGWPEITLIQCPPPPAERFSRRSIGCATMRRADFPDCPITVQDWYNCELSEPYWWCRRPRADVCLRPAEICGPEFFFP